MTSNPRFLATASIWSGLNRAMTVALLDCRFGWSEREIQARNALTEFFLNADEESRRAAVRALDRLPADRQLALKGRV